MAFSVGETLQAGKYHLDALLEEHPWGSTFLSTHQGVDQQVIIKTFQAIQQPGGPSQAHLDAYISFAQKLVRFHHPGLSRVINVFEENHTACMVSEFIQGTSFCELIKDQPLNETVAIQIIKQVTQALHGLHRHGLLHLNLSPRRILQRQGHNTVILIGLNSRFSGQGLDRHNNPYLALEQTQAAAQVSLVSEIYGIAATLYTLVTGKEPTPAAQRANHPLLSPRTFHPNLSETLEDAIMQGMALDPRDRPPTLKAWLSLLPQAVPNTTTQLQAPPAWAVKLPALRDAEIKIPVTTVIASEQKAAESLPNMARQTVADTRIQKSPVISSESDQNATDCGHPEQASMLLADRSHPSPEQETTLQVNQLDQSAPPTPRQEIDHKADIEAKSPIHSSSHRDM
ncbi:MAG: protein kinase, partial [Acaryochloridaceae cyanobacterium RL_2_7]|nr:protein kinase [Acaryochloridaceae cyanobacterium RL_2_7]